MSDVPVASYLSSGIDSSLVSALAAKDLGMSLATFTGAFREGGWYDETRGARWVADAISAENITVTISPDMMRASFDDMMFALDEPRMGLGAFPQYIVAKKAAETRKLILTGHGGDELFSGYPVFKLAYCVDLIRSAPAKALRALLSLRATEVPHLAYFGARMAWLGASAAILPTLFSRRTLAKALTPAALAVVPEVAPLRDETKSPSLSLHDKVLRTYLTAYLPGLLVVEDKISMAHSLESRTPLLDNEFAALALEIPENQKLANGELKAILRRIGRKLLPPALFSLPKRGFPTPMRLWFRADLADWMEQRIAGDGSALRRLFRVDFLTATVRRYRRGIGRYVRPLDEIPTHRIWMLLALESWLRQHETRLGIRLLLPQPGPRE